VCVRSVNVTPATSTSTNWPAVLGAPPFNPQVVNVLAPNSTYAFTMKCYNDSGSTTFTLPNITTNDGPPPTSCSSFTPPLPAGWLRLSSPQSMPQVPLLSILGQNWNNFPNGGGRGIIATANGRYISLAITAPTDVEAWNQATPTKAIFWDQSQSAGPATLTKVLVTISECAGDFRLPPAGPAPATDPTYARGCRSYRALTAGGTLSPRDSVPYQITTTNEVSTETTCKLAPGKSYHINFIRADVRDNVIGTPSEEVGLCEQPNQTSCGVDMNVE
jgi:hypothetical protein